MLVWSFLLSQAVSRYTTHTKRLRIHSSLTAKATTNAELESTTHASSLCCFSRVLFYNFTITDIYPTTEAVWGVVWETNLLLRASWIKSLPSRVALVLLLVVSHYFLLRQFIILPTPCIRKKNSTSNKMWRVSPLLSSTWPTAAMIKPDACDSHW